MKSIIWLIVVLIVGLTFYSVQGVLVQAQGSFFRRVGDGGGATPREGRGR